jgi:hypothetical protein
LDTTILPIDTVVRCTITDKLGLVVAPPAPRGHTRVLWDGYLAPTLQWTSLLIWRPSKGTNYIGPTASPY